MLAKRTTLTSSQQPIEQQQHGGGKRRVSIRSLFSRNSKRRYARGSTVHQLDSFNNRQDISFGSVASQNKREYMEDFWNVTLDMELFRQPATDSNDENKATHNNNNKPNQGKRNNNNNNNKEQQASSVVATTHFFGVFDGHGGDRCASYISQFLPPLVSTHPTFDHNLHKSIQETFRRVDDDFLERAKRIGMGDGSTAVVVLVRRLELLCANVGDSRAILVKKDGGFIPLSRDHKPDSPAEEDRIVKAGGSVIHTAGCARVNGRLAVSRSFGDLPSKPSVTSDPEIITHTITENDQAVVLASDGLFDAVSNEQVAKFVTDNSNKNKSKLSGVVVGRRRGDGCSSSSSSFLSTPAVAKKLVAVAKARGSTDNITVVVVDLSAYWLSVTSPSCPRHRDSITALVPRIFP